MDDTSNELDYANDNPVIEVDDSGVPVCPPVVSRLVFWQSYELENQMLESKESFFFLIQLDQSSRGLLCQSLPLRHRLPRDEN